MSKNTNKFLEGDIVKEFFEYLMTKYPQKEPVVLVRRKNLNAYGYYSFNGDKHFITINDSNEYDDGIKCEGIAHEAGHMLYYQEMARKHKDDNDDPHCDKWGVFYSRCYRAYLDFIKNK